MAVFKGKRFLQQLLQGVADKKGATAVSMAMEPLYANANCCALNAPGLVVGTGDATKVKLTNATACLINGKVVIPAAATEISLSGINITSGSVAQLRVVGVDVDATGTGSVKAAPQVSRTASGVAQYSVCTLPELTDDKARLGYIFLWATSGAAFTGGTNQLATASGILSGVTFIDSANTHDMTLLAGSTLGNSK